MVLRLLFHVKEKMAVAENFIEFPRIVGEKDRSVDQAAEERKELVILREIAVSQIVHDRLHLFQGGRERRLRVGVLKQEDLDEPHKDGGERNEPHHHAPELEDQAGGFFLVCSVK